MRAPRSSLAAWIASCLLLAGLVGLSITNARANDESSSFDNLEIVDASLNEKLAIQRVGSEASMTDLLSVFAGLKNKTSHTLNLQVETIYKDKDGNPVNAGSWITLTLKPHEEREYRSTSISVRFNPNLIEPNFLIRIRRAPTTPAATH